MIQLVSIVGALMILAAYAANQFGRLPATRLAYTTANTAGAGVLAVIAAVESQWGFLLLEGVWCILAAFATARIVRGAATA